MNNMLLQTSSRSLLCFKLRKYMLVSCLSFSKPHRQLLRSSSRRSAISHWRTIIWTLTRISRGCRDRLISSIVSITTTASSNHTTLRSERVCHKLIGGGNFSKPFKPFTTALWSAGMVTLHGMGFAKPLSCLAETSIGLCRVWDQTPRPRSL
ncbi:uncharacterized protein EI90DRAFT_674071 [Cantharellus anzutake]|uniref:uncharacterized protein n=1 Tax=Cantharellus anzutake TaxID=1750568 RepID=UPI00190656E0|nr:uncharacterized protein EI90DRAFT_674071 [Cantharellus anzutake]KAF8332605.1 hypothetical protein EI90DRAFT_674071 [Cantharellus anzutake]